MSNMQAVLQETSAAMKNAPEDKKALLAGKLSVVLEDIIGKLSDFSDIPENYITNMEPQIHAQIKAIDTRTEHAADLILGACENMSKAIKDAPDPVKKAVQKEVNAIFEASNFQDLVSQHANEIRLLMEDVKADMEDIQNLTGAEGGTGERSRNKNKRSDSHLLNGPPMPDE